MNKEQGNNWEIRRGLVSPDIARVAGEQALFLWECFPEIQQDYWQVSRNTQYPGVASRIVDVQAFRQELLGIMPELAFVYARTERDTHNELNEFFLNRYEPYGSTAWHKNEYEDVLASESVVLAGPRKTYIKDPGTGQMFKFELNVGDGLYLNNDVHEVDQVLHYDKAGAEECFTLANG